jgi:hypothetical protein
MPYTGRYITDADIDNWPSGTTAAEQAAAIQIAEARVEKALGWSPYPKPFDIRLNGNRGNRLTIPTAAKIIAISEVQIYGVVLDPSWYSFDGGSIYLDLTSSGTGGTPELLNMMSEAGEAALFPKGIANIRIKGTTGEAAVPAWAKEAVRILIRGANDPSLYTTYGYGMASESIGNYSYSARSDTIDVARRKTGIQEADDLIWQFRRKRPILGA